jgi:hypothetical protein
MSSNGSSSIYVCPTECQTVLEDISRKLQHQMIRVNEMRQLNRQMFHEARNLQASNKPRSVLAEEATRLVVSLQRQYDEIGALEITTNAITEVYRSKRLRDEQNRMMHNVGTKSVASMKGLEELEESQEDDVRSTGFSVDGSNRRSEAQVVVDSNPNKVNIVPGGPAGAGNNQMNGFKVGMKDESGDETITSCSGLFSDTEGASETSGSAGSRRRQDDYTHENCNIRQKTDGPAFAANNHVQDASSIVEDEVISSRSSVYEDYDMLHSRLTDSNGKTESFIGQCPSCAKPIVFSYGPL